MLSSLRLQNFRCFSALDIEAGKDGAILTGDNAQGKTSILEAICILVRLHSPRTHRMASLARFGSQGFGVAGDPWGSARKILHTPDSLALMVEGEPQPSRSAYLQDGGRIVWMGNEDLELVRGPGETRRRYLDFICSQIEPGYLRALARYRRALQAKNLLLKSARPRDAELVSYEHLLVEHGTHITATRARVIDRLAPLAAEAQQTIGSSNESLTLHYLPASGPDLRESILQARERETRTRQAVVGPHRDDLSLRLRGMPASEFASEGQQRTLAISLKLAQGRLLESLATTPPIYLIDDIFGELDPTRRDALLAHLPAKAQKWITTTHPGWLRDSPSLASLTRYTIQAASAMRG